MAPLPLFHRPLSQDNSRETSLSSGRGGGRSTGPDTSGSGSGVSLPMRHGVHPAILGSGHPSNNNIKTPTTPDTPSTTLTATASSDYLVPLTGGLPMRPQKSHHGGVPGGHRVRSNMASIGRQSTHTTATPVSSPSDEPNSCDSDADDADLLLARPGNDKVKTRIFNDEAETSFTCSPPPVPPTAAGGMARSTSGYSNLPPSGRTGGASHHRRKSNGSNGGIHPHSGSNSSSSSSSYHGAGQPSRSRLNSTQPLLPHEVTQPPPPRPTLTSVIQNPLLPSPPTAATIDTSRPLAIAPPPPPRGYSGTALVLMLFRR